MKDKLVNISRLFRNYVEPGASEKGVHIYSSLLDCPFPHRPKATQFDVKMLDLGIEYYECKDRPLMF